LGINDIKVQYGSMQEHGASQKRAKFIDLRKIKEEIIQT